MTNKIRPIHPGEILRDELKELRLSANKFAAKLHVPTNRITAILNGHRSITADTALRLSVFFGTRLCHLARYCHPALVAGSGV